MPSLLRVNDNSLRFTFARNLQDLKATVTKHEKSCDAVCTKGQAMIEQSHYAANDIQMKVKLLQNNFSHLKELVEIRGDRLKDAVQSLQVKTFSGDSLSSERIGFVCFYFCVKLYNRLVSLVIFMNILVLFGC
jgi:hypothetical protein